MYLGTEQVKTAHESIRACEVSATVTAEAELSTEYLSFLHD